MKRIWLVGLLAALGCGRTETHVGSKADSESVLLGEAAVLLIASTGESVSHRRELGSTPIVWEALRAGVVDVYPEFTGTLAFQIYHDAALTDLDQLRQRLDTDGIGLTAPLGYQNNYALGVRRADAERRGLKTISDLVRHPDLRFGLSTEFTRRADGWPALKTHYQLPFVDPQPLEHAVAYQALQAGQIDVVDVYTTDAEIKQYDLVVLDDDRQFFPEYAALFVFRKSWAESHPEAISALGKLAGKLDAPAMRAANAQTRSKIPEASTAAELIRTRAGVEVAAVERSRARLVLKYAGQHLTLVGVSLTAAVLVAVPLGVLAARRPRTGQLVIGATGLVQTIPSLALLVILVAVPVVGGLGARPAILALFLYSLLPIVRNTATGLTDIPLNLREVADGLGLSNWAKLTRVELPLASRNILGGIKTAAVINIGTATLGALIGAGGLGVPIQEGLRLGDDGRLLEGALPAAGLALAAQGLFGLVENRLIPRGLRLPMAR